MGEKIMKSMEIRSSEITTSASNTLTGYVVRWDNLSELLWGEFYEKFQRGAFTEWLAAGNDVRGLYEHDHSMLLGRTRSGTLKLEEDETGLRFELTPPDTSTGRDVIELVKRGDISGMSFGFRSRKDVWDTTTDPCVRTVLVAQAGGKPTLLAVDAGRKLLHLASKPTFANLDAWVNAMLEQEE